MHNAFILPCRSIFWGLSLPRRKVPVKTAWISTRVPDYVEREIKRIVVSEAYNDVADYVRELIRRDFRERGITFKDEIPEESGGEGDDSEGG